MLLNLQDRVLSPVINDSVPIIPESLRLDKWQNLEASRKKDEVKGAVVAVSQSEQQCGPLRSTLQPQF